MTQVRVAEFWEYEVGGGLVEDYHFDGGSVITIVCLANSASDFTGGAFRTFECDGTHLEHKLDCGDVLCLLSHKYHNVAPVLSGQRHTLVLELWQDSACEMYEDDDEVEGTRMAADEESGFVACCSKSVALQALRDGESKLEFVGLKSREEVAECVQLAQDVLLENHKIYHVLEGISFASCALTSDDLQVLGKSLRSEAAQNLVAFGLGGNPGLDRETWHRLWCDIPENLVWLDFGDNQLTDADVAPLIESITKRTKLEKLHLDGNKLRDLSAICTVLPNSRLLSLDLGDNDVDDPNLQQLSLVLSRCRLRTLVVGTNPVGIAGVTSLFSALPSSDLREVYLDHTDADDSCLVCLSEQIRDSALSELHMDNTRITESGIHSLIPHIGSSKLACLDVSDNGISKAVVKTLQKALAKQ
eukprot:TRINITY_DN9052_c0_g1_i2.p1 TRINITY_DN9052_c0_g1~~TRINITY_DN9052_c0_g1_i2.p1  ORF type:complete len:416 (+),score=69.87 TRINITY_DN9052_c0_g1_i2:122-1369(+)